MEDIFVNSTSEQFVISMRTLVPLIHFVNITMSFVIVGLIR